MKVDLDTDELYYLLDNCLRGSHLRSMTIERFVDQWYDGLNERQRMCLFEWAVRLTYSWSGHNCFEPQTSCCGKDVIFMKRYHPRNQYIVTTRHTYEEGGKKHTKTEHHRTFLMDGNFYVGCTRYIDKGYIKKVEKLDIPEWEEYRQPNIDYDKNILE